MYDTYIRKWERYAAERQVDKISPPVEVGVNFLASLADVEYSYSAIATARSALSCSLNTFNGVPFGNTTIVKRFMKGMFEQNPSLPKYVCTWDVNSVLEMLELWTHVQNLTFKELTLKLCMLLALLSGQRCQTLQVLDISYMDMKDNKCTFYVKSLLKHTR